MTQETPILNSEYLTVQNARVAAALLVREPSRLVASDLTFGRINLEAADEDLQKANISTSGYGNTLPGS